MPLFDNQHVAYVLICTGRHRHIEKILIVQRMRQSLL